MTTIAFTWTFRRACRSYQTRGEQQRTPNDLAKGADLGAYLTSRNDASTAQQKREIVEASMEWFLTRTTYRARSLPVPQSLAERIGLEVAAGVEALRGIRIATDPPDGAMGMTGGHGRTGKGAGALAQDMLNETMAVHRDGGEGRYLTSLYYLRRGRGLCLASCTCSRTMN